MATWKKLVVSGSNISQLNNDAQYISASQVPSAANSFSTASFNGTDLLADSSQGTLNFASGSTGLNIVATAGTDTLTFDLVAVPNASLANDGITIAGQDISLGGTITADTIAGQISAGTITNAQLVNDSITVGTTEIDLGASSTTLAGLTSVASTSITGSLLGNVIGNVTGDLTGTVTATSVLADGVTATTQTQGDNSTKVATTAYVDAVATAADLDLSGDGGTTTAVDLDSQTLAFSGADGIQVSASAQAIVVSIADASIANAKLVNDGITIAGVDTSLGGTITADTIAGQISAGTITNAQLANSTISGISLGSNLADLTVDNSSLELSTGTTYNGGTAQTVNVKALGITNAMLAGSITNAKLVNSSITIGDATVALGGSTTLSATGFNSGSFSGSFEGDGSGLTGLATTLNLTDGSNPQAIDLISDTLTFSGTSNEIEVSTATTDTVTIGLPDDVTIGQDLTVTRDLTVSRNLTVLGTASFQHTEDLDVADRFIRLASGSTAAGDGGIVIQQTGALDGEVFGFDSAETRFGISGSFDASQNVFTPDAFMAAVINTNGNDPNNVDAPDARYNKKGNLYVAGDSEDIWIYS